ncbi:hypothetical protein ACOME3_005345 [Neoechinorhynchus agilis]
MDHILYRGTEEIFLSSIECYTTMGTISNETTTYRGKQCCYSDHQAVYAVLAVEKGKSSLEICPSSEKFSLLCDLKRVFTAGLEDTRSNQWYYIRAVLILMIVSRFAYKVQGVGVPLCFSLTVIISFLLWQATFGQQYERIALTSMLASIEHELEIPTEPIS